MKRGINITEGIYIKKSYIWGKSRKLVVNALGGYYTSDFPFIFLNFVSNFDDNNIIVLNKKVSHVQNKITMNKLLDEYQILHPKTYYYPFIVMLSLYNKGVRCVVKNKHSQRGRGVRFTRFNKIDIPNLTSDFYVQHFIPFDREYRVGIDFMRVLGVREKLGIAKCKNSKTCNYITIKDNTRLERFARDVAKKFEMDFCGIDIGEYNNNYYIIEINSAPTVGEVWARKLSNDLIKLYNKRR